MAEKKQAAGASFDEIIRAGRKKKDNEKLAQQMLGTRRSSTPANLNKKSNLSGSLASRVGIMKRPSSLSRSQSSQTRVQQARVERSAPASRQQARSTAPARPVRNDSNVNNNNTTQPRQAAPQTQSSGNGLSIKGAAGGPYIVIASNFAKGTSAADIQSVMEGVGGEVMYCKLLASSPNVIAEMSFREKSGADAVISTFNNKKADGRLLQVRINDAQEVQGSDQDTQSAPAEEYQDQGDDAMELDENARSREAENKLREERRGGNNRGRQDAFPSGPRNMRAFEQEDNYYYNDNRGPAQQQYQDGRYGFGGGGYGRGGRYQEDRRGYGGGRGRGGQWRN